MMTGVEGDSLFRICASCRPSRCGMPKSVMTASNGLPCLFAARKASNPLWPLSAIWTWCPSHSRISLTNSRNSGSSSMNRIRIGATGSAAAGPSTVSVAGASRTGKIRRMVVPLPGALLISMPPS